MEDRKYCSKKGLIVILSFHNWLDLTLTTSIHENLFNTLGLNVKQMLLQVHFDLFFQFSSYQGNNPGSFLSKGSVVWGDKTLISYKVTTESDISYNLEFNAM